MKKIKLFDNLKTLLKIALILFVAVFQVSFFLNQDIKNNVNRKLAQDSEAGQSYSSLPLGMRELINETEELSIEEDYDSDESTSMVRITKRPTTNSNEDLDEVDYTALIPENLPPEKSIQEAIRSYKLKLTQCEVRTEDKERTSDLYKNLKDKRSDVRADDTEGNNQAYRMAYYEFAVHLIDLGLLVDFETTSSSSASSSKYDLLDIDIAKIDIDLDDESTEPTNSIFLDEKNPEDLKQIAECHLRKMNAEETDAEKKAYFEKHIAGKYQDSLLENIEEPTQDVQQIANEYYVQSSTGDQITENKNGFYYSAQTHGQSALVINTLIPRIQNLEKSLALNPADTTLQTQLSQARTDLVQQLGNINAQSKDTAAKDPALSQDATGLQQLNTSIDQATEFWATEASKLLSGEQSNMLTQSSTTVTPSVSNPNPLNGYTPRFSDNAFLGGANNNSLDNNPMASQPYRDPLGTGQVLGGNLRTAPSSAGIAWGSGIGERPQGLNLQGFEPNHTRRPRRN